MFKETDFKKDTYKISEVSDILKTSHQTIRNYIEKGELLFLKEQGSVTKITKNNLLLYLKNHNLLIENRKPDYLDIIYAEDIATSVNIIRNYPEVTNLSILIKNGDDKKDIELIEALSRKVNALYLQENLINPNYYDVVQNICTLNSIKIVKYKKFHS